MEKVKVVVRMRPLNINEKKLKCKKAWNLDIENDTIKSKDESQYKTDFNFDGIISQSQSNKKVYQQNCKDLISRAIEGIDTTIFVYGQTGAGKTHTILGKQDNDYTGIIYNSLVDIFDHIKKQKDNQFKIACSYLEIYNDLIYDLLTKQDKLAEDLQVYEDSKNSKFIVKGKIDFEINSVKEGLNLINFGESNRTYAQTYFNHKSSRSHTIFQIQIKNTKIINGEMAYEKESLLNLVDLAGNERLMYEYKQQGSTQGTFGRAGINDMKKERSTSKIRKGNPTMNDTKINESKHINKSLFFLTQVIKCVSRNEKSQHIPFRNSPLTKILRSSFGGNSRTLLILCCAPAKKDFDISLSTLRFGKQAKKIQNVIKTNIKTNFNQANFNAIIQQYEDKVNGFYEKLNLLEKEHRANEIQWENLKKIKNKILTKLLNFNTPDDRYKYLQQNKKKFSDSFLLKKPGLIFTKLKEKKIKNDFCHQCSFREMLRDKKFNKIKNKKNKKLKENSFLESLQKGQNEILNILQQQKDDNEEEVYEMKKIFQQVYDFIEKLIQQINSLKKQLLPYQDKNYINSLKAIDVHSMEVEMRKLWEFYYQESITRNVLKKNKIKKELQSISKYDCLVDEQKKEFKQFKKDIQKNMDDFFEERKENQLESLKKVDFMKNIKDKLKTHLQDVEKDKIQLQNTLNELKIDFENEKNLNQKRLNFLQTKKIDQNSNQILKTQSMKNIKFINKKLIKKQGKKVILQEKHKNQQLENVLFSNRDIFGLYSLLNRKLYKLIHIGAGLDQLKGNGQDKLHSNLIDHITGEDQIKLITNKNNQLSKEVSFDKKSFKKAKTFVSERKSLILQRERSLSNSLEKKNHQKSLDKSQKKKDKKKKLKESRKSMIPESLLNHSVSNKISNLMNNQMVEQLPISSSKSSKLKKYQKKKIPQQISINIHQQFKQKKIKFQQQDLYFKLIIIMQPDTTFSKITPKGKFVDKYLFITQLGSNDFQDIWKVININNQKFYAIKTIDKFKIDSNMYLEKLLRSEVVIMNQIKHPNLMHLYNYFESKNNYYLVVDYCEGGSLENILSKKKSRRFSEEQSVYFLKQIINAFVELRKLKILHRNITLSNIFLKKDNIIVIGEFGLAKQGFDMTQTQIGNMETIAYEILSNMESGKEEASYNYKADLWSIGVIFYQMLQGVPPFKGNTSQELLNSIEQKTKNFTFHHKISEESQDFITGLLRKDPEKRMNWNQVLEHDLFKQENSLKQQDHENEFNKNKEEISQDMPKFLKTDEILEFEKKLKEKKTIQEIVLENGKIYDTEKQLNNEKQEKLLFFAEKFLFK